MKNDTSDLEQISYAKTVYGQEEIDAVVKCLSESTQMGNYSRRFEQKIADLFNKNHCLYVNSGSSALYIGVEAFNFPVGGEVITPVLTFSTSVGCLIKNDLTPVFVDVEPLTYCIDVSQIEAQITEKTVAILAPNLMGNLCDWPAIREIADRFNLIVIEDSADTLGATINGQGSGFYSDMSITSFYGSHIINCAGNGGALAINDKKVMEKAKLLRSWGRSSSLFDEKSEAIENRFNVDLDGIDYDAKFVFETVGYNLEGSEIGASFGMAQLNKLDQNIASRQANFDRQCKFFDNYPEYFSNPQETYGCNTAWLAFPVLIKDKCQHLGNIEQRIIHKTIGHRSSGVCTYYRRIDRNRRRHTRRNRRRYVPEPRPDIPVNILHPERYRRNKRRRHYRDADRRVG